VAIVWHRLPVRGIRVDVGFQYVAIVWASASCKWQSCGRRLSVRGTRGHRLSVRGIRVDVSLQYVAIVCQRLPIHGIQVDVGFQYVAIVWTSASCTWQSCGRRLSIRGNRVVAWAQALNTWHSYQHMSTLPCNWVHFVFRYFTFVQHRLPVHGNRGDAGLQYVALVWASASCTWHSCGRRLPVHAIVWHRLSVRGSRVGTGFQYVVLVWTSASCTWHSCGRKLPIRGNRVGIGFLYVAFVWT